MEKVRQGRRGQFTFVDPKLAIPMMAIIASSSSFTASMASPSSGSPASTGTWSRFWGDEVDDCAMQGRTYRISY